MDISSVNRRDFLKGTAWMGATALAAGCQLNRLGFGAGGIMQGFALKPMNMVRVGFVGIGGRGTAAVNRVSQIPGVEVVALCDKNANRVEVNLNNLKEKKYPNVDKIKTYIGTEAYKELCDFGDCDVVYCATPWALHQPVGLRALLGGKVALIEVTSAMYVDQCWELVEASEKYHLPCMQLENCVYGEIELLELHLARLGILGELVHGEGSYIHDLREVVPTNSARNSESDWRYGENMKHKGNQYPTHGLVPLCQTFGINRGDRLDYLVSMESDGFNCEVFKKEYLPDSDPRKFDPPQAMGDMNTTVIRTVKGKTLMVQHDVISPRPYTRTNLISGTRGIVRDYVGSRDDPNKFQCAFEKKCFDHGAHNWFTNEAAKEIREKYMHPMWRNVSEMAKKVGGHGGMDFIMDLRWAYCLLNGYPLDMDVYDLAATSCLCELTEKSVRSGSKPMSVPDFTRGNWKNVKPWGVVNVDLKKMGLGIDHVSKDKAQMNV